MAFALSLDILKREYNIYIQFVYELICATKFTVKKLHDRIPFVKMDWSVCET